MEEIKLICSNPWCKATFFHINDDKELPTVCKKCTSFNNQLSGGITWEDKKYEGDQFDNTPHQIKYKINKYY